MESEAGIAAAEANEPLIVDVDGYEGPLDVLLALARVQKVDLRKISILALAEQYLTFIEAARHIGGDKTGGDTVDGHASAAELSGQRATHARNTSFGRGIVSLPWVAARAHHRGDIYNTTPACLHHAAHDSSRQPKYRGQIGVQHSIPFVVFHAH
jgi:hypothetical protein